MLNTWKGDLIGVAIQESVLIFSFAPIPISICLSILLNIINITGNREDTINSNLLFKIYSLFFDENCFGDILIKLVMYGIIFIVALEVSRTPRILIVHWVLIGMLTSYILKLIKEAGNWRGCQSLAMRRYKILYQIHSKTLKPTEHLLGVAYQFGLTIIVFSLTAVIIGWKFLPMCGYLVSLYLSLLCVVFLAISIPTAVYPVKLSRRMVHEWKYRIGKFEKGSRRENKMALRTLRPIGFPIWGKGIFDEKLAKDILGKLVNNTADLILFLMKYVGSHV